MTSAVAEQLSRHLPGIVDTEGTVIQWLTPGGRHANLFCATPILATIWTHNDNSTFPKEYNSQDLYTAARAIRKQAFDLAFENAFNELGAVRGAKYSIVRVFATDAQDGLIIRLAVAGIPVPCLELKHTATITAQVRPVGGAFYPQPQLTEEIINDLWGSEENLELWYGRGIVNFMNDPDSALPID